MAVLSTADRNRVARLWARKTYVPNGGGTGTTAALTHTQIRVPVDALDNAFEANPNTLPNAGTQSLALNLNTILGTTFLNATTVAQRSDLVNIYISVKYGGELGGG